MAHKPPQMLIRFVAYSPPDDMKSDDMKSEEAKPGKKGIFHAAYTLKCKECVSETHREQIAAILLWFGDNLRTAHIDDEGKAVCWYKPEAKLHIEKTQELAEVLRASGFWVTINTTTKPGYVVYDDDIQVAAIACNTGQMLGYQVKHAYQQFLNLLGDCLLRMLGKQETWES